MTVIDRGCRAGRGVTPSVWPVAAAMRRGYDVTMRESLLRRGGNRDANGTLKSADHARDRRTSQVDFEQCV